MDVNVSDQDRLLFNPNISLNGAIVEQTLPFFLERLQAARSAGDGIVMEINTSGGNADVARRIAQEIRLFIRHSGQQARCVGKTNVYSAGMTILAAFPKANRYLTDDAVLLIHERQLDMSVELRGPLTACLQIARDQVNMIETSIKLEMEGFRDLVEGSTLTVEELHEKAKKNCYLTAGEALEFGLIAGILD